MKTGTRDGRSWSAFGGSGGGVEVTEENPVCLYLIRLRHGDASIFLRCKGSGTLLVLSVLAAIYRRNRPIAHWVAGGLSLFQLWLLLYLTLP